MRITGDLDAAWRHVAGRLDANTEVTVDDEGRLHTGFIEAIPDPVVPYV